jgi:cytochrome b pre-mRNA-processing protein 3
MVLGRIFPGNPNEAVARSLYERIVAQTREPAFYRDLGVPDSVDGRFELLLIHSFLVLHRMKGRRERLGDLAQTLMDTLFFDLDQSIRVSGVGDLGVGPRLGRMAQAFYGRISVYEAGLAAAAPALETALQRNLYGTVDSPGDAALAAMAGYLRREVAALAERTDDDLLAGELAFGAPPPLEKPAAAF